MLHIFRQPYPFESSFRRRLVFSLIISVFIFLFLLIFQPFQLNTYPGSVLLLTAGYGLVAFVVMACYNLLLHYVFKRFMSEENWTAGREIISVFLLIALIGLSNGIYTTSIGIGTFNWRLLLIFEVYTVSIALFPITLTVLLNQLRLQKSYHSKSEEINRFLNQHTFETDTNIGTTTSDEVTLLAENGKDEFRLSVTALLYLKSADNYIEIHYLHNGLVKQTLLRTNLKKCADQLSSHPEFWRCHKSYIVNLSKVKHISGNAQGFRLHLEFISDTLPVSRALHDELKQHFAK